jgi:hypothetical protein
MISLTAGIHYPVKEKASGDKRVLPRLPLRFEEAMHRHLGRSCIFFEVNGKYPLSEERLKEVQEKISSRF